MNRILESSSGLMVACATAALVLGCHRHPESSVDHDHDHPEGGEPKSAQVTVWGQRHEIFAEHRLVVANSPTKFVTHVTELKTGQPRRGGAVRFRLQRGEEASAQPTEAAPVRAGIYEPMLAFPQPGDWTVTLVIPTEDGEETVRLPPVKVYATQHDAEHGEVVEPPEGIHFLKEQQWRVRCTTEPIARRALTEQLRLPAVVAARPGLQAQVVAPVSGRFGGPPDGKLAMTGDRVAAGQTLALLEPSFSELGARFVEAEAEVIRAKLAYDQAEAAFRRVEALAKVDAKSPRELQEAEFALKSAQARLDAARALQATYRPATVQAGPQAAVGAVPAIELRSPIAGILTAQPGVAVGEYLTEGRALFSVLDASTVLIETQVPETSVPRLGSAMTARYEVPGQPGRLRPVTGEGVGRLAFLGIEVNSATRTVPLVYETANPGNELRVGQSLDLYVETTRAEETLAIPQEAIVDENGRPVAFVQLAGETFEKRDLVLGIRDGNWVQVRSGLEEGERVVSRGAYAVRLASVSTTIPSHGHAH